MAGDSALEQAPGTIWDAHSCLPLRPGIDMADLERHRRAGAYFVSLNVGMDMNPVADILQVIAWFRDWLARHPDRFVVAETLADVEAARDAGKLAVAFDLEGAVPLADRPEMLAVYHRLGVRQIHLAYNRTNAVCGGCHDDDPGLSDLGRAVVAMVNTVGMIMDCSHTGERSSLDIMAASTRPVVFSHANVRALVDHARNVSDRQIDACAATGGVIGINGIDLFLGEPAETAEAMATHVDYLAQRVGIDHVGLGLDYSFNTASAEDMVGHAVRDAYWWPPGHGYDLRRLRYGPPELLPHVLAALQRRGYDDTAIEAVAGANFHRIARQSWQPAA